MKANEASFLHLIRKSPQFSTPIYQRTYSWTDKECRQLWEDIIRTGNRDDIPSHFVGSVVYITQNPNETILSPSSLLVIDGQQRLTTLTLLLAALADYLNSQPAESKEPIEGFSPNKIISYYLINKEEEGEKRYKLILTQTDKESLIALLSDKELPKEHSVRIAENFELLKKLIAQEKGKLVTLCKGLAKLMVVEVALNRAYDNPQLIFESMNSTGKELSQADLIRNFVLMGLENNLQADLYDKYWRPMEISFGQEAYTEYFDDFMRHYLTLTNGEIPRKGEVYEAFKEYSRSTKVTNGGIASLVAEIRRYSRFFCAMAFDKESDPSLREAFYDLKNLKVDVAYPFLLELYNRYDLGLLSKEDFLTLVRTVESYVFRRVICSIPTNSLNKTLADFAAQAKSFEGDGLVDFLNAKFHGLVSYKRFPNDEEFRKDISTIDLYNRVRARTTYCLRKLENHRRKEKVNLEEYSIEHIMPQNPSLQEQWRSDLGEDWERVHNSWLHTLGNLTLTGYNSEYSDRPFAEKRDMEGGFKDSPLKLNEGLGNTERWNEDTIISRGQRLSDLALKVWPFPETSITFIESPTNAGSKNENYTIESYPYLSFDDNGSTSSTRELFDSIRKEILALDPCVTEHFLKLYIAYKADTNFVDIVPQRKGLRISLNMRFMDLTDSRGICKDVTKVGRWGNGDVEVLLASKDEIPYVMGLIRQSFESQMVNEV
ncbi:GmrSD restriction endonuclease domain-containing protein [Dethiosulfovibrio salsuginis]|uniref:Predicted transport protein n=1 Tax=Dethiosulfovibrio salsuginis TaxID=561720 RepID=A0A1X7K1U9_9BACT|nr:DUF262 domain-containing protein [Dethiosulfovibrio salsuginis]SMG34852.1 Predicted transport protein [Dethiosulfovibrio salsuginis]